MTGRFRDRIVPLVRYLQSERQRSQESHRRFDAHLRADARRAFRLKVYSFDGQAYEDLFVQVMQYKNPNFRAVKPQGKFGDRKNDGFDRERGAYYQVYAPEDLRKNPSAAVKKARQDFEKLRGHWNNIKEFYFVVNDKYRGVYPEIETELSNIKAEYGLKRCKPFLAQDLERTLFSLASDVIAVVTGLFQSSAGVDLREYGFGVIQGSVAAAAFISDKPLPGEMTNKAATGYQRRYLQDKLRKLGSRQLAKQILVQVNESDKQILALVGTGNIISRVDYLSALFPDFRWKAFVKRMKQRGCLTEETGFLKLVENIEEDLFHDQEFAESARNSWITVLTPMAHHWDLALGLCVHLLALKKWKMLIEHAHEMISTVEEGWVSELFFDILSKIAILRVHKKLDVRDRILLLNALGTHQARQGRNTEALTYFNRMLSIARSAGDVWGVGQALLHRSLVWLNAGNLRRAESSCREAEAWARENGDDWLLGRALNNLFYCLREENAGLAWQAIEESVHAKQRSGDRAGLAAVYAARGIRAADEGRNREALIWFRRTERIARKFSNRYGEAQALHNQNNSLRALGRHQEAVHCAQRAYEIADELGRPELLEIVNHGLALGFAEADQYEAALPKFLDLYESKLARGDVSGAVTALSDAGVMALRLNDHATARRLFRKAISIGFENKKTVTVEHPILSLSALWIKEGKPKPALRFLRRQIDRSEEGCRWRTVISLAKATIGILIENEASVREIEVLWSRALGAAKKSKDVKVQIELLNQRYGWIRDRGDTVAALAALDPLIRLTRRRPNLTVEFLEALNEFSNRLQELGQQDSAEKLYRAALAIAREIKSDRLCSIILNNLAETLRRTGRPDEAIPFFQEAAALDRDDEGRLLVEHNLALALEGIGERGRAKKLLEMVRDRSRYGKHWYRHGNAWLALGDMALDAGENRSAVSHYRKARKVGAAHDLAELVHLADERERQVVAELTASPRSIPGGIGEA